jgi:hypothetical protein
MNAILYLLWYALLFLFQAFFVVLPTNPPGWHLRPSLGEVRASCILLGATLGGGLGVHCYK